MASAGGAEVVALGVEVMETTTLEGAGAVLAISTGQGGQARGGVVRNSCDSSSMAKKECSTSLKWAS